MADEKSVQEKNTGKPSFGTRFVNFFKNLPANIARPFRNMVRELKLVTWPSKKDVLNYTVLVLAFIAFMGIVIGLLDLGATELVKVMVKG